MNFEKRGQIMAARARARGDIDQNIPPLPVQLPIWPEPERAQANALVRSAVFSCARRREVLKEETLVSWGHTAIRYSGETLNQFDEMVWMQLVHMFRQQGEPSDFKVRFHAKAFMRSLGKRRQGGANVAFLRSSMIRLCGGVIEIEHKDKVYGSNLLQKFVLDESRSFFVATLNPDYLRLFGAGYTRIDWEYHKTLPTGVATWLHLYITSHRATPKAPHRIGLEQLRGLTGMTSPPKEFRRHLQRMMDKLRADGVVVDWRITDNDALEFVRPPVRKRKA